MSRMLAALVAGLLSVTAASASSDLERARALNDKANAMIDRQPEKAFEGEKGKVFCAWLMQLYPIQDELLKILERNPKFVGIGRRGSSHQQIVDTLRKSLAGIETQKVQCAAADFLKQLDELDDELGDESDE